MKTLDLNKLTVKELDLEQISIINGGSTSFSYDVGTGIRILFQGPLWAGYNIAVWSMFR